MSFDALTLTAVRDELEPLLTDSRVQRLVFLDELSLAIECFRPGSGRTLVLLSAHAEHGRVQQLETLPARGIEQDTPFALLARKHVRSARIRSLRQPRLERVLELDCEQHDASGQQYRVLLIVEAMGRRGNLLLVDADGSIMDAARRSPPSRNPRRPVLPHLPYTPPPPQLRLLPEELTPERLAEAARERSGSLARFLSDTLAGLSPLAGRELAYRVGGSIDSPVDGADWPHVLATARAFLAPVDTHAFQPTLACRDGEPEAFAPYELTHLRAAGATLQPFESISAAIGAFYASVRTPQRGDPLSAERRALAPPLERAIESTQRRVRALELQLESGQTQREPLRRAGELLLMYQAEVPAEAETVSLEGEAIALDPRLSVVDNAQAYFARYRKARETEQRVPELLEAAQQHLEYLSELRALVEVADQMDAIRALRREVGSATAGAGGAGAATAGSRDGSSATARARGQTKAARNKGNARGRPSVPHRRIALSDGWEALVGTSAAGNAGVTFDLASADDLWLHARGAAGAHVILRGQGTSDPPDAVLERAAELAAWHSAARTDSYVEVDVAPRRYVRKIPNGPPGLVRYTHERTLRVTPRSH